MHVKTNCKYFKWKKTQFINGVKINKNVLMEPDCELDKLNLFLSCPEDCELFKKKKKIVKKRKY